MDMERGEVFRRGEKRIFADLFSRPIYFRHAHLSSGQAQVD